MTNGEATTQEIMFKVMFELESENERLHDALDKIRAEISEQRDNVIPCIAYPGDAYADGKIDAYNRCLDIIDKYRKEQT